MFTVAARRVALLDQLQAVGQRRVRPGGDAVRLAADRVPGVGVHPHRASPPLPTTTTTTPTTSPATGSGGSCRSGSRRWTSPYLPFYVRNLKRRPRAEVAETAASDGADDRGDRDDDRDTGSFWLLAVIYLIPERIAMFVLAWWFDWLPHHGLEDTQTREPLPRDPQPGRDGVAVHAADALPELPPRAPPAPVDPVLPLPEDMAAQRGGLPRARRRDLDRVRPVAQPRGVPRVEAAQPQAAEGAAGADADGLHRPARGVSPAAGRSQSTRSPPTASLVTFAVPEELREEFRFEPGST